MTTYPIIEILKKNKRKNRKPFGCKTSHYSLVASTEVSSSRSRWFESQRRVHYGKLFYVKLFQIRQEIKSSNLGNRTKPI